MFSLILKDLLSVKKQLWFVCIYGFVMVIAFHGSEAAVAAIIGVSYMLMIQTSARDDKNKSEIMLISLPLPRKNIVLAKYIATVMYGILGIISYLIGYAAVRILGLPFSVYPLSFELGVGAFSALALMASIYYPLYFKLGHIRSNMYGMVLFFVFFFGIGGVMSVLRESGNTQVEQMIRFISEWQIIRSDAQIAYSLLLTALFLMAASYLLSLKFYRKREF